MSKWLCKNIRDEQHKIIDLEPRYKTTSNALPRGDFSFCHDSGNVKIPMVQKTENGFIIIENDNAIALKDAWKEMDDSIAIEASQKIGTTNRESLLAFVDAYQLRMLIPDRYATIGLKAEVAIGSFLVGDELNTAQKVFDYYAEVLFALDTHRLTEINRYLATKADLGF